MQITYYTLGDGLRPITRTGTTRVPKPRDGEGWIEGTWPDDKFAVLDGEAVPHVAPMARSEVVRMIKAEAGRRITDVYPMTKQANIDREGGERQADMAAFIDAIRAASNRLEALDPIPADFLADHHWSQP